MLLGLGSIDFPENQVSTEKRVFFQILFLPISLPDKNVKKVLENLFLRFLSDGGEH